MAQLPFFPDEPALGPGEGASHATTTAAGSGAFDGVDIAVLVLYFVLVLAVGFWSMCRTERATVEGYFLAGKSMTWWPVGASLFSSNVGSGHLIGLAGSGAAAGIGAIVYEWNGMFMVLLLAWIFLPIYLAAGVTTMPEYLRRRYSGRRTHLFIAVLSLFIYIFTKISVDMYAGALFIKMALQWDIYLALVLLLAVTALYTVAGGLAAVIYTDAAQTVVMLGGTLVLMAFSFAKVGGWDALFEGYMKAIPSVRAPNTTCGLPRGDSFHIFRHPVDSDLPWPGLLVGVSVPSMWYWCSDQVIVQRSLAAKTLTHAKGGSLLAAYLKILPFFAIMLPGMISRILYTDDVACADPELCTRVCQNPLGCSDTAYVRLVVELLPTGLRGLMMAVMIAALVSSLTSVFNSASTIFTMDLWKTFRSGATEWELMIVGRVFVLTLVAASVLWIPVIQASQGGQLFIYIQSISTYLQPPVSIIFFLGCFWTRTNEKGAFWGVAVGLTVGCTRMVLDLIYPAPACYEADGRPAVVTSLHYLYFSTLLSLITLIVAVVVSLATEKPRAEQLDRLTWFTRSAPLVRRPEVAVRETAAPEPTERCPGPAAPSGLRSALYWLCGMERRPRPREAPSQAAVAAAPADLREERRLKKVIDANLLLCLSVAVFIVGYWA
ncbi:sodium/myo-inositol cotransporter 2 isoform X2 [Stigmatopora nigra]